MNTRDIDAVPESPSGEGCDRLNQTARSTESTAPTSTGGLDSMSSMVRSRLIEAFAIADSQVGTLGLISEIKTDLAALRRIFQVPEWTCALEALRIAISAEIVGDATRDLESLRSQPKSPLRDFLTPLNIKLSPDKQRAIRAVRALTTLKLLAGREQITTDLADEHKRWLAGKGPHGLSLQDIQPQKLWEIRKNCPIDSPTAKLLTFAISALESKLADPFVLLDHSASADSYNSPQTDAATDSEDEQPISCDEKLLQDPLRGFLAEAGNAGVRIFSGVPLYEGMLPVELRLIGPAILQRWCTTSPDEGIAALLTTLTRVLPSRFSRVPLSADDGAGLWLDVKAGLVCWNLDEVVAGNKNGEPFNRSCKDRYASIPLPREVARDLQRRATMAGSAEFLHQLFSGDMERLTKTTGAMLRKLALTSHRPTLTHLSYAWARFVLSICNDEVYASVIGIDFTVGTAANLNYVTLRSARMGKILKTVYQQIGLSGELATETAPEFGSLWLPDLDQVVAFLRTALGETSQLIHCLPKRVTKKRLLTTHNKIAAHLYGVLKLMLAGRNLTEETITRSKIDLATGWVVISDKRISPYHERRIVRLPELLCLWLGAYLSWLQLVAYRLAGDDRQLSGAVASTLDRGFDGDRHPLFFRFTDDGRTQALGSDCLTESYAQYGIKNNGGRHFVDWLMRSRNLDSADSMGWMGRGNAGQETFGSWSSVVPLESVSVCAKAINDWLMALDLPPPPVLNPRPLPARSILIRLPTYIPELLKRRPEFGRRNTPHSTEPCPFAGDTVMLASFFPEIFRAWRRHAPPDGWLGLALSLILEDGVIHPAELDGFLHASQRETVYRHQIDFFIDCRSSVLGIRRVWLSDPTVRLLYRLQPESVLVDLNHIDKDVDQFLAIALPLALGRGLRFIMASAAAYHALHMPGLLYGWVRGFRFARTSRPETVARHLLGAIEHPKFDTRPRQRRQRSLKVIRGALRRANRKVSSGGSHKSALSWLLGYLQAVKADLEKASHEAFSVGHLIHLCTCQKNVSTVMRYESGARKFIELTHRAIAETGFGQVDWRTLVASCLTDDDGARDESPTRTAINHALEWLGIDVRTFRREGPPPAARHYAEMPSALEGKVAIGLLTSIQLTTGDDWHLAATALKLLFKQPHRWDALACLRLCDLALDVEHPHLAIAWEAGGNLKSDNAPRVLLLDDADLVDNLRVICAHRTARFPGDPLVPLFGDDHDPRNNDAARRIHILIAEALWHATGSPVIRPHDPRDTVISNNITALLDVNLRKQIRQTLHFRQGMFHITAEAGQSAPDVPVENYGHDFEVHRRQWITTINDAMNCTPSTSFLAKVTGVSDATYRKRYSRQESYIPDLFESFDNATALRAGAKLINLSSLVAEEQRHIPWKPDCTTNGTLTKTTLYYGLRLLGESERKARMMSRLTEAEAQQLEVAMNLINRRRLTPLKARADISRKIFADSALATGLVIAMHAVSPPHGTFSQLVTSISEIGDGWTFSNPDDILNLEPWLGVWDANHISTEVVFRRSLSSAVDSHLVDRLTAAGVKRTRGIPDRHFPRGTRAILRFLPVRDAVLLGKPRASPQISFFVSACAISLMLTDQGEKR